MSTQDGIGVSHKLPQLAWMKRRGQRDESMKAHHPRENVAVCLGGGRCNIRMMCLEWWLEPEVRGWEGTHAALRTPGELRS